MKYLMLIMTMLSTMVFANTVTDGLDNLNQHTADLNGSYHKFSLRYRTSPIDTISHLDIKNDFGIQWDFKRNFGRYFYTGSIYVSKANVSDTQGFRAGLGVSEGAHSLSVNYYGESNYEQWRIKSGDCKACNLDWINSNWRSNYYVKYEYDMRQIKPFIQYHYIANDRDEMLDDRFTVGAEYTGTFLDRRTFLRVLYDEHLTTFNLGFHY